MKFMAWMLMGLSGLCALAGIAPLSPCVFFPLISLPLAALVAWRGQPLPALLVVGMAVLGVLVSPISWQALLHLWWFPTWCVAWSLLIVALSMRGRARPAVR